MAIHPAELTLRTQCANAIRALAMDAVQAANSDHPGMPMGMADIAETLWRHHLKHDPADATETAVAALGVCIERFEALGCAGMGARLRHGAPVALRRA